MKSQSRSVESSQVGVHEDLLAMVNKHRTAQYKRPIAAHTEHAFKDVLSYLSDWQGEVILDTCCGVGESTLKLAEKYPEARVIGVDKSAARLGKHEHYLGAAALNDVQSDSSDSVKRHLVVQADLHDFWRLLAQYLEQTQATRAWQITKQYLLYPNPYPKKAQLGKRWHAGPMLKYILACCPTIEVRSNWRVYVQEFAMSCQVYGVNMQPEELNVASAAAAMTPFERKYFESNQTLWTAYTLGMGCDK